MRFESATDVVQLTRTANDPTNSNLHASVELSSILLRVPARSKPISLSQASNIENSADRALLFAEVGRAGRRAVSQAEPEASFQDKFFQGDRPPVWSRTPNVSQIHRKQVGAIFRSRG